MENEGNAASALAGVTGELNTRIADLSRGGGESGGGSLFTPKRLLLLVGVALGLWVIWTQVIHRKATATTTAATSGGGNTYEIENITQIRQATPPPHITPTPTPAPQPIPVQHTVPPEQFHGGMSDEPAYHPLGLGV